MLCVQEIDLLAAWERGRVAGGATQGALALLGAAYPDESPASLALLNIGARDALLLALRERLFGTRLCCLFDCAECSETLSVQMDVKDLYVPTGIHSSNPILLDEMDYTLSFRLPNSYDLLAIVDAETISAGRLQLLERVLISATYKGDSLQVDDLPEGIFVRMEDLMAQAEPQADIQLSFVCEACQRCILTAFDIASYLWTEVEVWAIRTLREIHELARAYGWSEAEILGMSPWRRRCYMELLGV